MKIEGGCHCGAVSFTAEVDPARVMICHCADCQNQSGAPFRVVVAAAMGTLKLSGELKSYIRTAQSGNRRAMMFCPTCATPIYACAAEDATSVNIRVGCVKQRNELIPTKQIWLQSAVPWLHDLEAIPGSVQQ